MHKILLPVLVLFVLFSPRQSGGQDKKNSGAPATITELQSAIEKVMKETGTAAAGLALVAGDSSLWVAGLGQANIKEGARATENTMFRIGSTTKMFVSLAILKLQEEGRLRLTDKVRDLVPEIEFTNPWHETAPIRVEHLLEHTTGWDDMHVTEYALNGATLSLKEGLDYHPHSRISRWMPGTRMSYCNSGPPVAAYIVEKITGQKFEDYIQEHFFQPMGMETMTFFASEKYKQLGATLYMDGAPQKYWNIGVRPSGAINASPKDMARMLQFFINRGQVNSQPLISEASLKRMESPSSTTGARAGLENGYGLSNYSTPHKSFVYRSHSGGVPGGLTDFSYLPTHKAGYVVMINSADGNALYRITELIRNFQTKDFASDKISRTRVASIPDNDITGYYVPINPRVQMTYTFGRIANVKHLWTRKNFVFSNNLLGGRTQTYMAIGNKQYVAAETGKISLVQVNDPLVGEVLHEDTQVLMRVSPLLAFGQLILAALWTLYLMGSILIGTIWIIRRKGNIFRNNNSSIGVWPYLTSLLFLMVYILQFIALKNPLELLGKVGFVSVSIMLLTIGFALAAAWSVINLIKERKAQIDKHIYWHLAILSGLHFIVTCYLLWHGVIGIQTWT